jgi:ABC-type branched-subunit amino acid transport system substrate-binding protein
MRYKEEARDQLNSFLSRYPLSEYYREAQKLLERLISRKSPHSRSIGLMVPLSGSHAAIGNIVLRGVWLATKLYSQEKSPYDDFEIVIKDTGGDPDITARAFDELVLDSRVIGIIGPMLIKPTETAALRAQDYQIPVILLNQSEDITQIGDFVFRNFITKDSQAKRLASFAVNDLGIKRFAFLFPLHNYGIAFTNAFWEELDKYPEVEVRGAESYKPGLNDFGEPIKKLVGLYKLKYRESEIFNHDGSRKIELGEESDPGEQCYPPDELPPAVDFEALVIPDNYEKIMQIAPSLVYYDVNAIQLIGGNLWNSENIFRENTGKYLQGVVFTDVFFKNSKREEVQRFISEFRKTFGEDPDIIANHSFEAASVMLQTIDKYRPGSCQALRDSLAKSKSFVTVSGAKSFSKKRNLDHALSILIIDGNEIKELY